MTLVIAVRCADGVIMASDSQAEEGAGDIRFPIQKIFPLTSAGVWGGSGQGQILDEAQRDLQTVSDALQNSPDLGQSLVSRIRPILQKHYQSFIPVVPGSPVQSPGTDFLACGWSDSQPWIIEIDSHCRVTQYAARGFHAIGSGAGFAQLANAMMAHFDLPNRPLEHGKLVAYRVMDSAIALAAYHLGPPIQMWAVDTSGVARVEDADLYGLQESVGGWKELERETLDRYLAVPQVEPTSEIPPEVPPNASLEAQIDQ